ncbi:hypothetical protein [Ktedonobacter robiniae]|nr:hypothetical protein [Ktedonobacter robiniae]
MEIQQIAHLLGPWSTGKGPLYRRLTVALQTLRSGVVICPGTLFSFDASH